MRQVKSVIRLCRLLPAFVAASSAAAQASSTTPVVDRAAITPAQMRDDVRLFRSEFMARDNSYAPAARKEAEARLARLESRLEHTTPVGFELAVAQIVALADNAHTIVPPGVRVRHFNRVPLRLATFGGDLRVIRAAGPHVDLLGAKLLSVDGHAVTEVRDSARTLVSGPAHRRDRFGYSLAESPQQLNAMGLAPNASRATYVFQTLDGKTVSRQLAADPAVPDDNRAGATRLFYPAPLPEDQGGWRTLLAAEQAPWALTEPDSRFRWRDAPEIQGMVIELRQIFDAPGQPIAAFLQEMTRTIMTRQPTNLVIDLRMNGGGNLNTARDFMKSVPNLVRGRIFALTSPWTFSAAISSLGYLEQAAPDRVTIVGEEVGDRLEFWAEGRAVTLTSSGIVIAFSTQRHDYKNACRAFTDCHGPIVQNSIAVPTLTPDISAPWTVEAYRAGRDPAIEAVQAELKRAR